jgi:signal transduction histidine kinase
MPRGGCCVVHLQADAQSVVVKVRDNGVGMSEATHRRVFEPFFTTKGPAAKGLGLAVVWGVITRHGGMIEIESTPGVGTTVTLRLPIRAACSADVESLRPACPDRTSPLQ